MKAQRRDTRMATLGSKITPFLWFDKQA